MLLSQCLGVRWQAVPVHGLKALRCVQKPQTAAERAAQAEANRAAASAKNWSGPAEEQERATRERERRAREAQVRYSFVLGCGICASVVLVQGRRGRCRSAPKCRYGQLWAFCLICTAHIAELRYSDSATAYPAWYLMPMQPVSSA